MGVREGLQKTDSTDRTAGVQANAVLLFQAGCEVCADQTAGRVKELGGSENHFKSEGRKQPPRR